MNIHEYQAKEILRQFGVPVPKGVVIFNPSEISEKIKKLNSTSPEIIINHATKILTEKGYTLRDDITALGIKL